MTELIGDLDLYLIGEGRHEKLWQVLGAHPLPENAGWRFAVWAPNAKAVQVIGDFSGWWPDDGIDLSPQGGSGVWAGTVPHAQAGQCYKFRVHGADDRWTYRADPLAFATQCPPENASVLYSSDYSWNDEAWMAKRAKVRDHHARPMSVYEVHLGSWRPGLSYKELADQLVDYVADLGFTHVEFLPVMEHPFGGSWGYQITGFFSPTARFGTPDEFRHLVDRLHQAGISVLLDWVPAHFPRDEWALARFDGTPLYEHEDWRRGEHPDWGTLVFNYGRREVRNFLIANARYWCQEFHVDGLRVDAVASMLYLDYSRKDGQWAPNVDGGNTYLEAVDFIRELNTAVYADNPGVLTIAEESTAWPGVSRPVEFGGLGFGMKWNMGWMHDTLEYVQRDPAHRSYHHGDLTWPSMYAFDEQWVLPLSHDEVVHGKRSLMGKLPGDRWQRLAGLRGLLGYMYAFPGKKLLFMGAELAQESEWSEQFGLDWAHADYHGDIRSLVRDLNTLYADSAALWARDTEPDGFSWIDPHDSGTNTLSFVRHGKTSKKLLACVVNFSGIPLLEHRIKLPRPGSWREVVNTDAEIYGGSGVGNLGRIRTDSEGEATIGVGPYAAVWFSPV
ncbi:1,4-alpha-glucan branching protein GlgB [Catellatospora sp. KI3]|uniref:1,4-alpha-glucan branching protein GlgB n=1 Tax=Catellatospora sp. KI3 TaxID=3041620 RepID=UPI0024825A39|nr:1,4-alpha-glucan branching protein GlgB [Catellatospora sp. KI3]MDI1459739.1 1,4-alpha-glucan branching protein GlgB [Catellatospora sp. KI3]